MNSWSMRWLNAAARLSADWRGQVETGIEADKHPVMGTVIGQRSRGRSGGAVTLLHRPARCLAMPTALALQDRPGLRPIHLGHVVSLCAGGSKNSVFDPKITRGFEQVTAPPLGEMSAVEPTAEQRAHALARLCVSALLLVQLLCRAAIGGEQLGDRFAAEAWSGGCGRATAHRCA